MGHVQLLRERAEASAHREGAGYRLLHGQPQAGAGHGLDGEAGLAQRPGVERRQAEGWCGGRLLFLDLPYHRLRQEADGGVHAAEPQPS
eukprot:5787978-Alexandrium_andersonii.AAC.1